MLIAIAIVGTVVAVLIVLLVTGGSGGQGGGDDTGDVAVEEGPDAPDGALADITDAAIEADGDELVLTAAVGSDIPNEVEDGAMEFRWEILEGGTTTWIVLAAIDIEPNVSLIASTRDFSASTVDDSLDGGIETEGSEIRVTIDRAALEGFPSEFEWSLTTTLDGNRINARSARASDRAPNEGSFRFSD